MPADAFYACSVEWIPVELEDYDINAAVGPETPTVHTNQPKISGIEVIRG